MKGEKLINFLCTLFIIVRINSSSDGFELMVDFSGEYPHAINLGQLQVGDTLKIKLLVPNITAIDKIEFHQGTYTN